MANNKSTSFGRYLKTVRLEKGIHLSDIAGRTRISKVTLEALEDEDHDRLPAEVFVKGFIRAHARVVKADGNLAVKGYEESRRRLDENSRQKADVTAARSHAGRRLWIFLGLIVVLAAGAVYFMRSSEPVTTGEMAAQPAPAAETDEAGAVPDATPTPLTEPSGVPPEPAAPADTEKATAVPGGGEATLEVLPEAAAPEKNTPVTRQRIHIRVVEDTWLKVIADSLSTSEYSLAPGDTLELEADREFNLLIGNATGIELTFNDDPVSIPGKTGQVVTIQLP